MSSDTATIAYLLNITYILYKSFALFIIIVSTIGNLCNCFVFLRIRALNKHPNALFIIGSSMGSLLFINLGLIPSIIQIFNGVHLLNQSLFLCKISTWLTYSSGCFSFMCNCYTAFGQFLITLQKIRWQRLITPIRAKLLILFTAIIWLLIFLPFVIFYDIIQTSPTTFVCTMPVSIVSVYGLCWISIGYYFLPILLILILFCLTWYNLKRLFRRRLNLESAITRMMLIQMSAILISGIPASICVVYSLITRYHSKTNLRMAYESLIILVVILCTLFTNGISFWIYLFVSKTFRKHLKNFLLNSNLIQHRIRPIFTEPSIIHGAH
jgi:hypothetical protein